jgi:dihydroorotate dehydrogenase
VIRPLVISAPFGNYVQPVGSTPTLGTFTAARRPGRLWRILRTVRYSPSLGAWVNKIGLRNPGIDWLAAKVRDGKIDPSDKLVSVHGFCDADWWALLEKAAALKPLGIELNMSCPNVGHVNWPTELFPRAAALGVPIVVKLPPVNYEGMLRQALGAGLRWLHCCNTIPVPAGGVSGKPLKPVAIQCITRVRTIAGEMGVTDLKIIGGGGVTTTADIDDYAAAGADRVAVGTKVFNPVYLWSDAGVRPLIEHARVRFQNQ